MPANVLNEVARRDDVAPGDDLVAQDDGWRDQQAVGICLGPEGVELDHLYLPRKGLGRLQRLALSALALAQGGVVPKTLIVSTGPA